ncbi:dihydrofolate reductase family protein [Microcoleus sp. A006_D1]|uniref:dihydrofolate reductase family protein n=1 Tax=Microcoleus sp. A006_D1 TaxID=3055267 RepID=UPI002FD4749D
MRKVVLFIASSLDGYIARSNGEIDWLYTDQNYGYTKFLDSIDTVLMGRKTYEQVLTFGEYPYQEKKSYVFTKNLNFAATSDVEVVTQLESFVNDLRLIEGKNIWLVGGSLLIRDFLNKNLVNELILSVHPLILGEGIPLFANPNTTALQLTGCQTYSSGMVQLSYDVAA